MGAVRDGPVGAFATLAGVPLAGPPGVGGTEPEDRVARGPAGGGCAVDLSSFSPVLACESEGATGGADLKLSADPAETEELAHLLSSLTLAALAAVLALDSLTRCRKAS